MWPILSNIENEVYTKMKSRTKRSSNELNCWIRVISGAKTATNGNGLIMQSNEDWGNFGDKNNDGNYYGGPITGGDLGVNINGKLVGSGIGRKLIPRPTITGITVKEGKDNISRECTLSMKCFSLEQMEKMQTYFLEPGYSLYIEYGWNTSDSMSSALPTAGKSQADIVDGACAYGLRYELLHKFRVSSNGEWDCFFGFITGGSVTSDGEFFNIEVKLRGQPALPTFIQNQQKMHKLDDKTKKVDKPNPVHYYKTEQLVEKGANVAAQRRFKNMYNDLPSQRQTESIRNLIKNVNKSDFINFDKVVTEGITTYTGVNAGLFTSLARGFADLTGLGEGNELDATSKTSNQSATIEKSKLFSANRYIKFDLAVDILNNNNEVVSYNMGGKNEVSFHIDISTSVIGAFKYMFSTNPKQLIIPGVIPDFSVYFLNADDVTQYTNGNLESSAILTPIDANVDGVRFVRSTNLNQNGIAEIANHWGYLRDLYVNFDMFVEKLSQSNKLIGEVLLDILNEMSAAANGFWNFQIVEKTSPTSGKTVLTVIDEHFVGIPPKGNVQRFDHNGADSIFLEATLDISIPGEMANKIIMDRLDYTVNPHSPSVKANYPKNPAIFNSETDIFLETVRASGGMPPGPPTPTPPAPPPPRTKAVIEAEKAEAKRIRNANGIQRPPFGVNEEAENWSNGADHARYVRLLLELRQLELTEKADAKKNLNKNIEKIDIVPRPVINTFTVPLKDAVITDHDEFLQRFSIFCLIDTPFFDMLKQESFANKVAGTGLFLRGKGLSQPLPIKYSFKTLGISGLRRGDMFNIDGIPSRYKERGLFQITELEQTVSDNKWYTNVTGEYRQII